MKIEFYKYHGTGNDFLIMDNRKGIYDNLKEPEIKHLAARHTGIGADGIMLLNTLSGYDFEMKYYNADGKESSMCGNGGRCITKFADFLGIRKETYHFMAIDGEHEAEMDAQGMIRLKMKDIKHVDNRSNHFLLDTGSPHYVKYVDGLAEYDVVQKGREIRNSSKFKEKGINVNFVEVTGDGHIYVRTYERGVEDETLSCGTGVTASAIVSAHNDTGFNQVVVKTAGGKLLVEFDKINDQTFTNVWLCGPATFVFSGVINLKD